MSMVSWESCLCSDQAAGIQFLEIHSQTTRVMAGLAAFAKASSAERDWGSAKPWRRRDLAIHALLRSQKGRGCPGHPREDALRAFAPGMTATKAFPCSRTSPANARL